MVTTSQSHSAQVLSIGILGAGQVVQRSHLPVLLALPSCRVAWLADADNALAAAVASAARVPAVALSNGPTSLPAADVVLVAIPYGAREAYCRYLQQRGQRAVFVEKPFAKSLAEHRSLCDGYLASNIAVGFSRRVQASTALVAELVRDGVFGPVRECRFAFGGIGGGSFGTTYADPKLAGGGMLLEVGIHGIDAVLYALQAEPMSSHQIEAVFDDGLDLHVAADWSCRQQNGHTFDFHFIVSRLKDVQNQVEIVFDSHRLVWPFMSDGAPEVSSLTGRGSYKLSFSEPRGPISPYQVQALYWSTFLGGLDQGSANETSAVTTEGVTRIVESVYAQTRKASFV